MVHRSVITTCAMAGLAASGGLAYTMGRRGLEMALLAHVVVSATLYLGMPLLR